MDNPLRVARLSATETLWLRQGVKVAILIALWISVWLSAGSARAQTAVPLPYLDPAVVLDDLVDTEIITFDAGTLPLRAHIEVEINRPLSNPGLELDLRMTCDQTCPGGLFDYSIALGVGESLAEFPLAETCAPSTPLPGVDCDLEIEVSDFGGGPMPATIGVDVVGVTVVPFNSEPFEFSTTPQPNSIVFEADRDTTLYEQGDDWNNGLGQFVWAGRRYPGIGPFGPSYRLHGMMTFDVSAPLFPTPGKIPRNATIDDAVLTLYAEENLGPVSSVSVSAVTDEDPNPFVFGAWRSGPIDAAGSEIESVPSTNLGATWLYREWNALLWSTPGAETGPVLASSLIPVAGQAFVDFSSPALTDAVRTMYTTRRDYLGFQYRASWNSFLFADQAVRFASKDNNFVERRPELLVYYTPALPEPIDGNLSTGAVPFIAEGDNFRWIYDEDQDDVLITSAGGRCEASNTSTGGGAALLSVPYTYDFQGDPSYAGLDCCTWQIDSPETNTTGTGQALFFVNVDASDPANFPPDTDSDGIVDLCDNCPYTPNGPFLGTCVGGPDDQALCRSDLECGAPSFCSLSQQDDDFVLPGQACPEPSAGLSLFIGTLWALCCRSRRLRNPAAVESHGYTLR